MNVLKNSNLSRLICAIGATFLLYTAVPSTLQAQAAAPMTATNKADKKLTIRTVNFNTCVDTSKLGKLEKANFEALKKQMEGILGDKEKTLNEIAEKFEDPDHLDSLSPEAETEMRHDFRNKNQELTQLQSQYYQALNQTNMKVVQKLTEIVNGTAATVAKQNGIDLILSEESYFFAIPELDISPMVVTIMDQLFDEAKAKEAATTKPAA